MTDPTWEPGDGLALTDSRAGLGEALYRLALEHLAHEVHIWKLIRDESGAISTWALEYANRSALKTWDCELSDVVGKTTNEIFENVDATAEFMPVVEQIFETGKPLIWEQFFDGTGQILQMVSIPMGEYFISTGLDITSQKQMEQELQQRRKLEAIGQLAGGVAHDFNNQLTGILGYAELLEGQLQNEEQLGYVSAIKNTAKRSATLTAQLLAFARKGKADFVTLDINALLTESINLLRHAMNRNIEIRTDLNELRGSVLGDESLLENVFLNIALNARDAMPNGGVLSFHSQELEIGPASENPGGLPHGRYVCIGIKDTGAGMDPEIVEHVFDPFFTTKDDGNGMGMASAYGSIQRHGGTIVATSTPGAGSMFRVILPLAGHEAETSADSAGAEENPGQKPATFNILVVDDEPMLCTLCEKILGRDGHRVTTFTDGVKALAHYEAGPDAFDIVIVDINMPGINGIELFRQMKATRPGIRALVTSGYSIQESRNEVLAEGFTGFIQKPFDSERLREAIKMVNTPPGE